MKRALIIWAVLLFITLFIWCSQSICFRHFRRKIRIYDEEGVLKESYCTKCHDVIEMKKK